METTLCLWGNEQGKSGQESDGGGLPGFHGTPAREPTNTVCFHKTSRRPSDDTGMSHWKSGLSQLWKLPGGFGTPAEFGTHIRELATAQQVPRGRMKGTASHYQDFHPQPAANESPESVTAGIQSEYKVQ